MSALVHQDDAAVDAAVAFLSRLRRTRLELPPQFRGGELVPSRGTTIVGAIPLWLGWLLDIRGMTENTMSNYALDVRDFAAYANETVSVVFADRVDHRLIERYIMDLQRQGSARSTAIRHFYALRSFFMYLEREGVVFRSPAALALPPKATPRRLPEGWIRPAEYEVILRALGKDRTLMGRRDLALIATPMMAGLRCTETIRLRVEDVDLGAAEILVRHGKGERQRFVTIVKPLRAILTDYLTNVRPALVAREGWPHTPPPADAGWLFPRARHRNPAEPMTSRTFSMLVHRRLPGILGRRVWTHLLRHSYASRLRMHGAQIDTIQRELGHARLDTTLIYAHVTTRQQRAEVERYFRGGGHSGSPRSADLALDLGDEPESPTGPASSTAEPVVADTVPADEPTVLREARRLAARSRRRSRACGGPQ